MQFLPLVHSAVDLNNFFSLQYEIPFGIYDSAAIKQPLTLRLGKENEAYLGLNGRTNSLAGKLVIADCAAPFGSPIVDSERTKVTRDTKEALHVVFLRPSLSIEQAEKLVGAVASMFTQIHGGNANSAIIS